MSGSNQASARGVAINGANGSVVAAKVNVNLGDPGGVLEELRRTCSLAMSVLDREVERLLESAAPNREVDSVTDDLNAVRAAYNSLCDRSFKQRFPFTSSDFDVVHASDGHHVGVAR